MADTEQNTWDVPVPEERSPLAPVTGAQVSAANYLRRRDQAAIVENEVDMANEIGAKENAFLTLSAFLVVLGCVAAVVLAWIRPIGRVDQSQIVADGANHQVYVLVNGVLHPAWNLVSAQLILGRPMEPTSVSASVLANYPAGPRVGIVDAPGALTIHTSGSSQWAVCDTAPTASSDHTPTVTGLAGPLTIGDRAQALAPDSAVLAEHAGSTYVVWQRGRSRIDLTNRPLALALGVDSSAAAPVTMSNALFDAIPATEALTTPAIADAGSPPPPGWGLGAGAVVGSVMKVSGLAGGSDELYVLLTDGLQRVEPFVASLLLSSSPNGQLTPLALSAKALASIPVSSSLRVDYYPPRRLALVDTKASPVLCVAWSKGATDRESVTTIISGKGLPIPLGQDAALAHLVRNDRRPNSVEANQVWVDPTASNLVAITSTDPAATSRESLWWVSPQGVRYGISSDTDTLRALNIDPRTQAVQAPWPMVQVFGEGPGLSRSAALVAADSLQAPPVVQAVPTPQQ